MELTPIDMDMGYTDVRLYRFMWLMFQNRIYMVGAYPPTPEMAGGFSLVCDYDFLECYENNSSNIRRFAFSTESLYNNSDFHIYKAVTDVEESFSIILTRIDYLNIYEKKNSELLLILLPEDLDSRHRLNVQEIDEHCVFYAGVYFDPTLISQASNSTLLRIS